MGAAHLGELGNQFRPSHVATLLDRLAAYHPSVVGVEVLAPSSVTEIEARNAEFREAAKDFTSFIVRVGTEARAQTKTTRAESADKADALGIPTTPADRRRLAVYLLGAYELPSAALQWSYLPDSERHADEIATESLATSLDNWLHQTNEDVTVGVALAKRLGLQRIAAIDDQTDFDVILPHLDQFASEIAKSPSYRAKQPIHAELRRRFKEGVESGDLLSTYAYLNTPEVGKAVEDAEWGMYLATKIPSKLDRTRVATWEIRNLNIASNIRRATALHQGERVLVIIGNGHKRILDRILGTMLDVRVGAIDLR